MIQKITPFFWFDDNAEEAVNYYTSIFKNSKITNVARYVDHPYGEKGKVMTMEFQLEGQTFTALNGGPLYKFSQAISFLVNCETQAEVDHLWDKLSAGGEVQQCGWLIDKFGVTWQIVPTLLGKLMSDKDQVKANRVMQAMLKMVKLDMAKLQQAYDHE
jgi:predicted 3-demethylubiquinone-9 3-methyltransferase (glyoxalase superfamily)